MLKSLRSLVLPILTFNQAVPECLDTCLPALYSQPRLHDSLFRSYPFFCERDDVPNKLAGECTLINNHNYTIQFKGLYWHGKRVNIAKASEVDIQCCNDVQMVKVHKRT